MRSLFEQNHYEVLEVPLGGTPRQIERAYLIARSTYHDASLATYSLYSEDESQAILRRIDEAYSVLSDERRRAEYDAQLARAAAAEPPATAAPAHLEAEPPSLPFVAPTQPAGDPEEFALLIESASPGRAARDDEDALADGLEPDDGIYDGAVLRRIRMSLGVELGEVAKRTKVNPEHLHSIEEDRYADLPSPVYVRGFVAEFARCLGLDPRKVASSYYQLMNATRRERR
jgi:curved DNA-binding protein CbpA